MGDQKNKKPRIVDVRPAAAIPGGELVIRGEELAGASRPQVLLGDVHAPIVVGSADYIIARVPEGADHGNLVVDNGGQRSSAWDCQIGIQVADSLHPVASPAVDASGNVFTTFSGSRGQRTPVAVYKLDAGGNLRPFITDMMNATGLAFDRDGILYVSSRHDGVIYQTTPRGDMSVFVEGMGVATGIAFDPEGNLYVGDRSGTIFKISPSRQIYVFATIEPSIAAYHLAFGTEGQLYVTGPTTSSFDSVYKVAPNGDVEVYYRGLGRPQGIALDEEGRVYVAASLGGRRGVVRIGQDREAELFLSGPNIVGLAFAAPTNMYLTTTSALFRITADVRGKPLP